MLAPLPVHLWPDDAVQAIAELRSPAGLTVIGVPTPAAASRAEARQAIRHALQRTLAAFLRQPVLDVTLLSSPGQQVRVLAAGTPVRVAISHMPGLSVAAISTRAAVGVDVMAVGVQSFPDWARLAHDYLGPLAAKALQHAPLVDRPAALAQAWTALEARLKCLGMGLMEWTPELAALLSVCDVASLALPAGICGAVAIAQAAALAKPPSRRFGFYSTVRSKRLG